MKSDGLTVVKINEKWPEIHGKFLIKQSWANKDIWEAVAYLPNFVLLTFVAMSLTLVLFFGLLWSDIFLVPLWMIWCFMLTVRWTPTPWVVRIRGGIIRIRGVVVASAASFGVGLIALLPDLEGLFVSVLISSLAVTATVPRRRWVRRWGGIRCVGGNRRRWDRHYSEDGRETTRGFW